MKKIQGGGMVRNATAPEISDAAIRDEKNATLAAPRIAFQMAKTQALIDNLPSWTVVETAIDNISNLADAKAFIKKLARVVYLDQKGKVD